MIRELEPEQIPMQTLKRRADRHNVSPGFLLEKRDVWSVHMDTGAMYVFVNRSKPRSQPSISPNER